MTQDRHSDLRQAMAKKLAMAYITASIANGYLEEAADDIKALGLYRREVKFRIGNATTFFDRFNQCVKWLFDGNDCRDMGRELVMDYETVKQALDRFMEGTEENTQKP